MLSIKDTLTKCVQTPSILPCLIYYSDAYQLKNSVLQWILCDFFDKQTSYFSRRSLNNATFLCTVTHISVLTDHSHFEGDHGIATGAGGGALVQTTVLGKAGIRQSNGCGVR